MKKNVMPLILLVLLLVGKGVKAQPFFIPASSSTPEYYNPSVISPMFTDIFHTCAYSFDNTKYLYSWSPPPHPVGFTVNDAGFVYKSTMYGTEGFQLYSDVTFLDVSTIMLGSTSLIFTSYYRIGKGHFYDIWKWDPATGGFGPHSINNLLSTSPRGTKISMDAHKGYGVLITWVENDKLFVKGFNTASGTLVESPIVHVNNAPGAIVPDIAFAHADILLARIAYIAPGSGDVRVINQKFDALFTTSSLPFFTDYIQPSVFAYVAGAPLSDDWHAMLSLSLQIDCPDHSDFDRWSYIFSRISLDDEVWAVSKYSSSPPVLMNLSDPLKGQFLSVAYDGIDPKKIHYGWYSVHYPSTSFINQAGYLSVERHMDGTPITPMFTFKRVLDNPALNVISKPVLSFSRNNESQFFIVYPYANHPSTKNIAHKILPWGMSTFGHVATVESTDILNALVSVYPNPFTRTFELSVQGAYDPSQVIEVECSNYMGQVLQAFKGTLEEVNTQLKSIQQDLPAGNYIIRLTSPGSDLMKVIKAVKL